jgi:hypothetical protein
MWKTYNTGKDLYNIITEYTSLDEDTSLIDESYLIELFEEIIQEKKEKILNKKERALEEYILRLRLEINEMKKKVADAIEEKEKAKKKLQIFLKVAARTGIISKLKEETEKVIKEEKDTKSFNTFFRTKINSLEKYEESVKDLDKLFDK